jgi:hypothetical protein
MILGTGAAVFGCSSMGDSGRLPVDSQPAPTELGVTPEAMSVVTHARSFALAGYGGPKARRVRGRSFDRSALPKAAATEFSLKGDAIVARVPRTSNGLEVRLPRDAAGPIELKASGASAKLQLRDAAPSRAEVADGFLVYRGALPGGDVIHRVTSNGTEDFFTLDRHPGQLTYDLELGTAIAGVRAVGGTLELLDEKGTPRIRMARPYLVDTHGKLAWVDVAVGGCAVDTNPAEPWGRHVMSPGASRCAVRLSWSPRGIEYPILLDPSWMSGATMSSARAAPASAILSNGKVLVAGGSNGTVPVASAEIYDPLTGTWASTGSMSSEHSFTNGVALNNGKVLVAGGWDNSGGGGYDAVAEIFDPSGGTWSSAGSLTVARMEHTSTLLADGRVVVTGGDTTDPAGYTGVSEIYDPTGNSWSVSGTLTTPRSGHSAVLLANGNVLVMGGWQTNAIPNAELFNPNTGLWTATGSLAGARWYTTATLLGSGKVLVAGGTDDNNELASAELYDPSGGTWSPTGSMSSARYGHAAAKLLNGRVLAAGGWLGNNALSSGELYDPNAGTWSSGGSLPLGVDIPASARLNDGRMFVAGGESGTFSSTVITNASSPCLTADVTTDNSAYGAGATINVTASNMWGSGADWVAIGLQGSAPDTEGRYTYTYYAISKTVSFSNLPSGTYVARAYFNNNGSYIEGESAPFTVTGATPSVTPDFTSYTVPATVNIAFANFFGSLNDWVAIGAPGSAAGSELYYQYTSGATGGTKTFTTLAPGTYVARAYFNNDPNTIQAESAQFVLNSPSNTTVTPNKTSYDGTEPVIITYANMSDSGGDWIAIATPGQAAGSEARYQYIGYHYNGTVSFNGILPGTYVARAYFNQDPTNIIATSQQFTVGGNAQTTVTPTKATFDGVEPVLINYANMLGSGGDWIGIALPGEAADAEGRYAYTGGAFSGQVSFSGLPTLPSYTVRAYFNNGTTIQASNTFAVGGTAVTAVSTDQPSYTAGTPVVVTYSNMFGSANDWIAIATSGSPAGSESTYWYTARSLNGTHNFTTLTPGTYVVRAYFNNNASTIRATSASFTVTP